MDQTYTVKLNTKTNYQLNPHNSKPGILELHSLSGTLVLFNGSCSIEECLAGWESIGEGNWTIAASASCPAYLLWDGNQTMFTLFTATAEGARGYVRISECL